MLLNLIKFIGLSYIDWVKHEVKYPYGVHMYVGLPGTGKTISVVEYLQRMQSKFPDIKVYTNFSYIYEDKPINNWQDLIDFEGPAIFVLDEVQLTFNSREWKSFPLEMVTLLTQNRKMKKQIITTSQSFVRVDKVFRELTNYVIECRCLANRWVFQRAFETSDYMDGLDPAFGKRRMRAFRYNFVQTEKIRNSFDTLKRLDDLKKVEYIKPEYMYLEPDRQLELIRK